MCPSFEAPLKGAAGSAIVSIERYPDDMQVGPMEDMAGKVLTGIFHLAGQRFMALDGGPHFRFNEAISLATECENQEEIDYLCGEAVSRARIGTMRLAQGSLRPIVAGLP